ncbi:MAG: hypothetical protein KGL39_41175 [Patescibacteria group bacterium]|nr:hypothetical protein [Patescibacteria group bacterium]
MIAERAPLVVKLPTFHPDQERAYWTFALNQRTALRCGRRWGKTDLLKAIASDAAVKREIVGFFAPDYKRLSEAYHELTGMLLEVKESASRVDGIYRAIGGGRIDFWTLEDEDAGRSRHYHKVLIDEGAFTKPNMMEIWERAIEPTLLDYSGTALVASNTNGVDPDNFFYKICNDPKYDFAEYHAPSMNNPFVPKRRPDESEADHAARRVEVFEKLRAEKHPLVFQQEYLAEFVDWSGVAFFGLDKLLDNGSPVAYPLHCEGVFAVIDTAVKTGREHDGTAVIYFALSKRVGPPLVVLDWDVVQIEGSLLETWLPTVFQRLQELAQTTKARSGSIGAFIEDKASGTILLQQAARRNWMAHAIDSKLTSLGKDERAISVSGYVYGDKVKISEHAYSKSTLYKGVQRNHMMAQVLGFRIGDKDAAKREDDLLDDFCYGISIGLGNSEGF